MTWLLFAILSPFLYSVTNYIQKYLIDKRINNSTNIAILGGFFSFILGFFILVLYGFPFPRINNLLLLLIAGMLSFLYLIPFLKALSFDDASRVVPLFQFTPVITLLLSFIILHETLSLSQCMAFVFILFGGFLLGGEKTGKGIFRLRKSFWFMMLACFFDACVVVLYKYAQVPHQYWVSTAYLEIGVGFGTFLALLSPSVRQSFQLEWTAIRGLWQILLINKMIDFTAGLLVLYATLLAPVALVTVFYGIQPFFLLVEGIILTLWFPRFIKEDLGKKTIGLKIVSVVIISIGVYLLAR